MSSVENEDLTRKQRREQARAERKAIEEAAAAQAARRRRLAQLGGAVAVVIVAIIVILIATGGSKSSGPVKSASKAANEKVALVNSEIGGIPQSGNALGSPSAPVTIQYFGDLECPVCKTFTLGALPAVIQKWVRPGKLRIEYRNLETATHDPETFRTQQAAAMAAGKQNKMWFYVELFYHEQGEENSGYVTEEYLQGLARQIPGLDFAKWKEDRTNPAWANEIVTDAQASNNVGFTGTPSFLIGTTGGTLKKMPEASLTDANGGFNQAIEAQLKA
jgi:protein-disulfide isomerase